MNDILWQQRSLMFCRLAQRTLLVFMTCAGLKAAPIFTPHGPVPQGEGAQSHVSAQPEYRVTSWTAEKGLPQNTIKALLQTSDGYLWVGTLNGLARFDGLKFKIFNHRTTPEMTMYRLWRGGWHAQQRMQWWR